MLVIDFLRTCLTMPMYISSTFPWGPQFSFGSPWIFPRTSGARKPRLPQLNGCYATARRLTTTSFHLALSLLRCTLYPSLIITFFFCCLCINIWPPWASKSTSPLLLFSPYEIYSDQFIQTFSSSMFLLKHLLFFSPSHPLVSVGVINHSSLSAHVLLISFSTLSCLLRNVASFAFSLKPHY